MLNKFKAIELFVIILCISSCTSSTSPTDTFEKAKQFANAGDAAGLWDLFSIKEQEALKEVVNQLKARAALISPDDPRVKAGPKELVFDMWNEAIPGVFTEGSVKKETINGDVAKLSVEYSGNEYDLLLKKIDEKWFLEGNDSEVTLTMGVKEAALKRAGLSLDAGPGEMARARTNHEVKKFLRAASLAQIKRSIDTATYLSCRDRDCVSQLRDFEMPPFPASDMELIMKATSNGEEFTAWARLMNNRSDVFMFDTENESGEVTQVDSWPE